MGGRATWPATGGLGARRCSRVTARTWKQHIRCSPGTARHPATGGHPATGMHPATGVAHPATGGQRARGTHPATTGAKGQRQGAKGQKTGSQGQRRQEPRAATTGAKGQRLVKWINVPQRQAAQGQPQAAKSSHRRPRLRLRIRQRRSGASQPGVHSSFGRKSNHQSSQLARCSRQFRQTSDR